jgi:endonuclease YncB( thermonuclease family)
MLKLLRQFSCVKKVKDYKIDGTDINWEDTIEFTFPIEGGRVIKVYDGDTITIASKLPFKTSPVYRFPVRLNGIDAPEIKGKNILEEEKTAAEESKKYLSNLILNKYIILKNIKNEKYGRILADVYLNDININEEMLKNRYAVNYDGGTKNKPVSWLKYKITGELL